MWKEKAKLCVRTQNKPRDVCTSVRTIACNACRLPLEVLLTYYRLQSCLTAAHMYGCHQGFGGVVSTLHQTTLDNYYFLSIWLCLRPHTLSQGTAVCIYYTAYMRLLTREAI